MTALARTSILADVTALAAPFLVGGAGAVVTADRIPTWYRALRKPSWNPPDGVFAPVWSTLYLLMGIAMVLVRRSDGAPGDVRTAEALNGLQLALNLGWTLAFFGGRDTRAGLAAIAFLWLSIAATIVAFARVRRAGALLLLPYLGWVTFAAALNARVWQLNRDQPAS